MEKKEKRGINKEVAGGNKISSGNKRKARKSMFLPSHRVQMKNNYDNSSLSKGGNEISSGNKRKARKSMFLPSHRVQMKNNYDNSSPSKEASFILWSFLLLYCLAPPLARVSSVTLAPTCLFLCKKSKKTPSRRLVRQTQARKCIDKNS